MKKILLIHILYSGAAMAIPGNWGTEGLCAQWNLYFNSPTKYTLNISCLGMMVEAEGTYEAKYPKIHFKSFAIKSESSAQGEAAEMKMLMPNNTCIFKQNAPSVRSSESITCKKGGKEVVFWNYDAAPKPGKEIKWKGHKVLILGRKEAYTNTCLKIREDPDISSKSVQFMPIFDDPSTFKNCIPTKTKFHVIARTVSKHKVQGSENYWYLIDEGGTIDKWVYGEYLYLAEWLK